MALYPPFTNTAVANAAGFAAISFSSRGNQITIVRHVAPECLAAAGAVGALRYNGFLYSPFNPVGDAISRDPPLPLWPGSDVMTVEWTGAPAGAVCKVLVQYELSDEAD